MNKNLIVKDNSDQKIIMSENINLVFQKSNGYTIMFGKNEETYSDVGPFIADIEITTACKGIPDINGNYKVCPFCYKGNTSTGTYMTLEIYKNVLTNLNQNNTITQVALGIDSEANTNPDLEKILQYTRSVGIVPNLTVANLTEEKAKMLLKYVGAIAISRYDNKDVCYNTIELLTRLGLEQTNMHHLVSLENYDQILETLNDIKTDKRLSKLNAIVLLSLKKKGRGVGFNQLPIDKFKNIYEICINNKINFGFDSCSANKVFKVAKEFGNIDSIKNYIEPCESTCMSSYCNVNGVFFPCSFSEEIDGWETGIDLSVPIDFINDCWFHEKTVKFRNLLLDNLDENKCRQCPVYKI